jgi:holo-[acyl-carrier protein] synthase
MKMIGIDIIAVKRFKKKKDSFLNKIFSVRELTEARKNNERLAGKWAAKEAAFKAGLKYANHEIEIISENKKPYIFINGEKTNHLVSISHDRDYATAVVFII